MDREKILADAAALITGDRNSTHGDAHENFERIAVGWTEILRCEVKAHEVGLCMAWVKIARTVSSPTLIDHYKDGAGYMALAGEIATARGDAEK